MLRAAHKHPLVTVREKFARPAFMEVSKISV